MTIENKRRELFEALHPSHAEEKWKASLNEFGFDFEPMPDGFADSSRDNDFLIWNAAIDAVVINLPDKFEENHGGDSHAPGMYDQAIDDCRAAIEQTGLGLKVLP